MKIEKLKSIIEMLNASKEDQLVALTTLNQQEHTKENLLPLMLAFKIGLPSREEWQVNAKEAFLYLDSMASIEDFTKITFKEIYTVLEDTKSVVDHTEMFAVFFAELLTDQCKSLGYDFIDSITLKLK